MTDPNHPNYCDIDSLRRYVETAGISLRDIRGDIGETVLFN